MAEEVIGHDGEILAVVLLNEHGATIGVPFH